MNLSVLLYGTKSSTFDNALQLFGLILLFCFVLVVTYLTTHFVGKTKLGQMQNKNFEVIETFKAAPNKFLQLVRMGDKYVVISIGKDDIRFITELTKEQIELPEEGQRDTNQFASLLQKVQAKLPKK